LANGVKSGISFGNSGLVADIRFVTPALRQSVTVFVIDCEEQDLKYTDNCSLYRYLQPRRTIDVVVLSLAAIEDDN